MTVTPKVELAWPAAFWEVEAVEQQSKYIHRLRLDERSYAKYNEPGSWCDKD